ncbi:HsdR family type I site-specific deoxyribonuclease [Thalassomonas sp. RHCl1]|uniref:type I restriction endonuclease subunit R n=1 Tax=Thalassomonas sp. RHCl1 TaxID=2995320 RepID=UPI00248B02E6|nr:HsdR family type I site-specific deoxyribonuclease [Thalassomonas sp. RHCl1]
MSEYQFVEKPLLAQLATLGWKVLDLGEGIPQDPATSLRDNFRQTILKAVFIKAVSQLNLVAEGEHKGKPWLTDEQLEAIYEDFTRFGTDKLLAANQQFLKWLADYQVDKNHLTGENNPRVTIINFEHWQANSLYAINQFRLDTPGSSKTQIRPDIVLFVNGLPLVVIECKIPDANSANPIYEGIEQLRRYADLREPAHSVHREGETKLFYTNQLMISTCGEYAKYGSITSRQEHYFDWKLEDAKQRKLTPQQALVEGMLHPKQLLDITKNFTLFMGAAGKQVKVICRYQQYRAVNKILARMHQGETGIARSGVVWHTQGSGKSLTMVFLVRKLRTDKTLQQYKVLMVNDRRDLEAQLGETALLTNEYITKITTLAQAKKELANTSSNVNLVMMHKFRDEAAKHLPPAIRKQLAKLEEKGEYDAELDIQLFKPFDVINNDHRILILVDEAHRTQRGGKEKPSLSDNLMDAFPQATRIAFTGTPLIAEHHKEPTWKRFGVDQDSAYIDKYKLKDAVSDGATLPIIYEGKTADNALENKAEFDRKFEDLFKERSEQELLEIRRKYGAEGDILEAEKRIKAISQDIVEHYTSRILPAGLKAQIVCSTRQAAIYYQESFEQALSELIEQKQQSVTSDTEIEQLALLKFVKTAVIISSGENNETATQIAARKYSADHNAIENFKRPIDFEQPDTGICILIVCDMLLTGFDAPIEQVMYIDKKVKEHNLLQTIARVNRTYANKTHGFIVDYIGLTNALDDALKLYNADDQADIRSELGSIEDEEPILAQRYQRILQLFIENKVTDIELLVTQALDSEPHYKIQTAAIDLLEDIRLREQFTVFYKKFLQSMDVIMPHPQANKYKIPMYQFARLQQLAKLRYRDDSLNFAGVGAKIRQLTNEHLISLGINPTIPPVDLLSEQFESNIKTRVLSEDKKSTASEMEHAIRKHLKVEMDSDPVFYKKMSDKLEEVIRKHAGNWEQMSLLLGDLRVEVMQGRGPSAGQDEPFYDLITDIAFKEGGLAEHIIEVQAISKDIMQDIIQHINGVNFWKREEQLVKPLLQKFREHFILSDVPQLNEHAELLATEVLNLAKKRDQKIKEFINLPEMDSNTSVDWDSLKTHVNGTDLYFVEELAQHIPYISIGELKVKTDIEYDAPHQSRQLVPENFARYGIHNESVLKGCTDLIKLCNQHLIVGDKMGVEQITELDGQPVKLVWAIRKAEKGSTDINIELIFQALSAYAGAVLIATHVWKSLQYALKSISNYLPALKENKDIRERIEPTLDEHYNILATSDSIDSNQSPEESREKAVRESKARYQAKVLDDGSTAYIPAASTKKIDDEG